MLTDHRADWLPFIEAGLAAEKLRLELLALGYPVADLTAAELCAAISRYATRAVGSPGWRARTRMLRAMFTYPDGGGSDARNLDADSDLR